MAQFYWGREKSSLRQYPGKEKLRVENFHAKEGKISPLFGE